jgi:hypothetical protein
MRSGTSEPSFVELAEKMGLSENQIAREILRVQVLSTLFQESARKEFVLKGGLTTTTDGGFYT